MPTRRSVGARRRDRHGRGLRADLIPLGLPGHRSRSERFQDAVLDAVERLEERWGEALAEVEFAVEDVPLELPRPTGGESGSMSVELPDEPVPLARTLPAAGRGEAARPARIIIYRRPVEARSHGLADMCELVFDLLVHEIADLLGVDPSVVDPEGHGED